MIGVWTFRIATSAIPVLTGLEVQLQTHTLDFWALGAAAVGSLIVGILHYARASGDPVAGADPVAATQPNETNIAPPVTGP